MAVKEPKKKPRTFISFHHKDRHAKELLKAQSKNKIFLCILLQHLKTSHFQINGKQELRKEYKTHQIYLL